MSKLTDFLKLHIWEIPKDNNENFDYIKSIAENFEKVDTGVKNAVNKFTEPLSYKGQVSTKQNLPTNAKNGDIYNVTSENKNYIYNGTNWVEYSSTLDLTYLENNTKTTQTTEVSEELTINNCAGVKGKLDIKSGKTEQVTRSGKNVLPNTATTITINGITFTVNSDKSIKISGTSTTKTTLILNQIEKTLSSGNYTMSFSTTNISGLTIGTQIDSTYYSTNTYKNISLSANATFKKWYIDIESGKTINTTVYPQFESGSSVTNYEPYGVSPSPEYPSRIRNVGDNINIFDEDGEITNKFINTSGVETTDSNNKFIKQIITPKSTKYVISYKERTTNASIRFSYYNGNTFISREVSNTNGYIFYVPNNCTKIDIRTNIDNEYFTNLKIESGSISTLYTPYNCGSADFRKESRNIFNKDTDIELVGQFREYRNGNISTNTSFNGIKVKIKPNTSYISNSTEYQCSNLCFFDKDMKYISGDAYTGTNIVFTTPNNCEYITLAVHKGLIPTFELKEIQDISFPFTAGQVLHKGDYLASDGTHHKRKTLVLTGTENWLYYADSKWKFRIQINDILPFTNGHEIAPTTILSNYFSVTKWNDTENNGKFTGMKDINKIVSFCNNDISTLNEWKDYLAEKYANGTPVIVEYELAEEIVIPYTEEQKESRYEMQHLLMYEGYTNITCIDEIKPDIQGTYYFNNELNNMYISRIDSLEEKIRLLEKLVSSQSGVSE